MEHPSSTERVFHANRDDRNGLCGTGVRSLLCGFRSRRHLRRQGREEDRGASSRRDSDLRARPRRAGRDQCEGQAARLHHRSVEAGRGRRCRLHRGRHAVAPRRRSCRSVLCLRRRARDRAVAVGLHRRRDQVDRPGRHRRRGRAHHPRDQPCGRRRGRLQPRIPARGRSDPRLQVPRSRRRRHLRRARPQGDGRRLSPAVAEPGPADVHGAPAPPR
ncbi:hypothetical protein ACVI53_001324 [Bradyrhizobium barranii subsp. barranii]